MNYYGPQRFGSPRFLSHLFGLYLFHGDIDGLLKAYFVEESPFEWPYITDLRRKASAVFGDWKKMGEIFKTLPYTFRLENTLLAELEKTNNRDYYRILGSISKQVDLWAKAYSSYLANRALSFASVDQPVNENIPLVMSRDGKAHLFYEKYLREDGTENFIDNLRKLPFIYLAKSQTIETRFYPDIKGVKTLPEGVAISFDLIKGAYATTVLMHLFDTLGDIPVPEWVNTDFIDTKKVLGSGSSEEIKARLGSLLEKMIAGRN